jgi:integrase
MAKQTITRALARDLPPPPDGAAKVRIFDDRLPGFILERRRNGATFYLRYTDQRGRGREVKLGRYGDVTVDQARAKAVQLRASVSLGADPVAERAKRRAVPTLAAFVSERYLPHVRDRLRSAGVPEAHLRLRILPFLGRKPLDELTPEDVAALRRRLIAEGLAPGTVNRHLATLRSALNLALRWQLFEGRNPAASPGMLTEQHRDRFLSATETQALVRALDLEPSQDAASALALLILTGARKQEALRARWDLVDLERGVLTVPISKSGRPRHVPLSPAAVAVLQGQAARRVPGNPYVFPSRIIEGAPLEGLRKPWDRAKRAAGLAADLRIHDLRHSLASALANAGTPLYEIGALLGHRQLSTTTRYAHHSPQRMVETATAAARAWNLLPAPEVGGDR